MFPEIEDDVDDVVYVDEVADLTAVFVACRPFKEGNFPCFLEFMVFLEYQGCHLVLVVFLRSEDVEITETDDLALGDRLNAANETVELELGIGIGIQRLFAGRVSRKPCLPLP